MATRRCEVCGAEFESTVESCPRCGEPFEDRESVSASRGPRLETRFTDRLRAIVPEGSDAAYRAAVVLAVGYAVLVTISVLLRSTTLFAAGVVLLVGSLLAMYLDLLNLETRLYDVRPVLWIFGAALMYFLVFPLYVYRRQRIVA